MKLQSTPFPKWFRRVGLALAVSTGLACGEVGEITESVSDEDKAKIDEAAPEEAPAKPQKDRKVLVFSLTKGFRHSSIPHGVVAMDVLGRKSGAFSIEHSEDPSVFAADNLERFDAVMMLNTTGELFEDKEMQAALAAFVKGGKGLIGIHSATDTFYEWPEYGKMMGGYFDGHPWHENVTLKIEDTDHSTCQCFEGDQFKVIDEIYQYREEPYSRERLRVLMSLDPDGTDMKKDGMKRKDDDYAVGWVQKYGEGNVFYSTLGHREETYWNPTVLQHFLAGIQFAIGDLEGDTTPSASLTEDKEESNQSAVLEKGDRLAIVGDSITEQKLYSKFIETYLIACMPELDVQCFQFGWGGERAPGFADRMENDLMFWKPDVVTTSFGMNDGSYRAYEDSIGQAYQEGMRRILDELKRSGATVVVGSPGVVDSETWSANRPEFDQVYNDNLKQLRGIAEALAEENDFPFSDVFGVMMKAMVDAKEALGNEYPVGGRDGVHPEANGHLAMAFAYLKALGMDGDLGSIRVDWSEGNAEAKNGHAVKGFEEGKVEIESDRYAFCFFGEENDANGTRSILPYVPFSRELNRFELSVEGLPTEKAEVKWGEQTKTFTSEQLAEGINLAAEFIENPFVEPFNQVMEKVAKKQAFETPMIKDMITRFRAYDSFFPEDPDIAKAKEIIRDKLIERSDALAREAKEAMKPITHTLEIHPIEE